MWHPNLGTRRQLIANTLHANPCSIEHNTFLQVSIRPLLPIEAPELVLGKFGLVWFKPLLAKPQTKLLRISQTKLKLKPN
jgi:hypothetical protein